MNEQGRTRIIIADPQPAVRIAVSEFLRSQPNLDVVARVDNGLDLMAQLEAICPDLTLLDWDLPGGSTADLVFAMRDLQCHPRVIVLSVHREAAQAALDAGADAFVYKGDGPKRLLTAIHSVLLESRYA